MDFIAFFAKSLSSSACRHRSIQQLCNTQAVVVSVVVYKRPGHVHDVHFLDRLDLRYMIPRKMSVLHSRILYYRRKHVDNAHIVPAMHVGGYCFCVVCITSRMSWWTFITLCFSRARQAW